MGGCRCIFYLALGHQKINELNVSLKGQEADPNIPAGLVKVGVINLP